MIPLAIRLKGFLSYKDEQDLCFDGKSLWMLAGGNGSGKSTLFDAVTYALYGHHRGGSQHAHELINNESSSLLVEFDFQLNGEAYRARRTLQRNARGGATATQGIYQRQPDPAGGVGRWLPVAATNRKAEFDAWVSEHLGLTYETFTSSVLLLQGKAEKLLDATAKGRFEILAGIVNLERFERLHRCADERRKECSDDLKSLQARLAALPDVTAEALAAADQRTQAAEAARQQAQAEVERRQGLEFQARQWADVQDRLTLTRQQWQQGEELLAEATAIERDVKRLHELRGVLAHVQTAVEQRRQIQDSERQTAELSKQKQKVEAQLAQQEHTLEQVQQKRAALQSLIQTDEHRQRDVASRFRQAATHIERVKEYERQEGDLARVRQELAALPADPAVELRRLQEAHDHRAALAQAVPLLARLQARRDELRLVQARAQALRQEQQVLQAQGEQQAAAVERMRAEASQATQARQQADEQATRACTLLEQARQHLAELAGLKGAQVCRTCGQELSPRHLHAEKQRREHQAAEADTHFQQSAAGQQTARQREEQRHEQLRQLEQQLQQMREAYRDQRQQADQAHRDVERLQQECGHIYAELAEPFRSKVSRAAPADWAETTYPAAAELAEARQQTAELSAARQRLRDAEAVLRQWTQLKGQETTISQSLVRLRGELPAEPQRVRKEHAGLEAEEKALERGLSARRAEALDTQKQLDRLAREREQTQQQLAELNGRLQTEEKTRQQCRQVQARALKELPPDWRGRVESSGLAELYSWHQERDRLVEHQTEERYRRLQQARVDQEVLRRDLDALEGQAAQIPVEARDAPARLQALLRQARQTQRAAEDELGQARQHKVLLEGHERQRQQLQQEITGAEREYAYYKQLAELLGRDRLQLHLIRAAERQVVDHANAVLDRLSGGQLFLRLCGEAGGDEQAAKALELEAYNRATSAKPINVAFLSGSQKFRVAVSLALGIGQYTNQQQRPIESVIIDEGFGSLDKEGRQAMMQELKNLQGCLRRILLVSHQEEMADAFADGYHFELRDGSTRVERFRH
jgi:exonuclease SbcC